MSANNAPAQHNENRQASALATLLERHRLILSKLFVGLILLLIAFTASSWQLSDWAAWWIDSIALVLLLVACIGRIWCATYISGNKNATMVTSGPYSMVRNPLYVFSFIGAIGVGLLTHTWTISLVLLVFFIGIYPFVIAKEEANLQKIFGDKYTDYCRTTPRLLPSLKLYTSDSQIPVTMRSLEYSLFDSAAFVLVFIALTGLRLAHQSGLLPVAFSLP